VPPYLPRHIASWAFLRMASTSEGSAFASGLISLLQPVVIECDQRLQGVFDSQRLLAAQIDALASQLDRFNSVSGTPPLYPHIDKLLRAKARMVVINTTLASIQHRISRLQNEQAPRPSSTTTPLYVASSAGPLSNSTASTSAAGVSWSPLSSSSSSSSSSGRGAASGGLSSWLSKARSALSEAHEPLSKLPSLAGLAGPVPSYQQAAHPAEDPPTSSPSSSSPTEPPTATAAAVSEPVPSDQQAAHPAEDPTSSSSLTEPPTTTAAAVSERQEEAKEEEEAPPPRDEDAADDDNNDDDEHGAAEVKAENVVDE